MIDKLMKLDSMPKSGEDVFCSEAGIVVGGCAYNVASTLRNMGCEHDLCVPVGKGPYADIISAELEKCGYDVLIRDDSKDNGYCMDFVEESGERTFITIQGIEGDFKKEWFDSFDLDQYDKIYVSGYEVCDAGGEVVADWLSELPGKQIYFAPGPVICKIDTKIMDKLFSMNPILHVNEKEAMDYSGKDNVDDAVRALYDHTKNLVVVTLGADGTAYFDGQNIYTVSSVSTTVTDTIGAGDSHIGAIIGGLSKGWDIDTSIRYANRVAANIVSVQGPVMTKEEFDKNMEEKS
jgi:sugar/nucleoside kinase (ribokinase family)